MVRLRPDGNRRAGRVQPSFRLPLSWHCLASQVAWRDARATPVGAGHTRARCTCHAPKRGLPALAPAPVVTSGTAPRVLISRGIHLNALLRGEQGAAAGGRHRGHARARPAFEGGTGRTGLARQMATAPDLPLIEWPLRFPTRAVREFREDDVALRLRDASEHRQGHARRLSRTLLFARHPLSRRGLRKEEYFRNEEEPGARPAETGETTPSLRLPDRVDFAPWDRRWQGYLASHDRMRPNGLPPSPFRVPARRRPARRRLPCRPRR